MGKKKNKKTMALGEKQGTGKAGSGDPTRLLRANKGVINVFWPEGSL